MFFAVGAKSLPPQSTAERIFPPQVSKTTKDTPIFRDPSKGSELLGDAPAGTPILLRGYSPKRTWILVEDEEGASGWVPANRVELPMPDVPVANASGSSSTQPSPAPGTAAGPTGGTTDKPAPLSENAATPFQPASTLDAQLLGRYEFHDFAPKFLLGVQFGWSRYHLIDADSQKFSRSELSVGLQKNPDTRYKGWNLPIRYAYQRTRLSSDFFWGPELSYFIAKRESGKKEQYIGLAYMGSYKFSQFSNARLRLAYDLGKHSHLSFEGGLQWMFY